MVSDGQLSAFIMIRCSSYVWKFEELRDAKDDGAPA
jgi:hypothetical protein